MISINKADFIKFLPMIIIILIIIGFDCLKAIPKTLEWIDAKKEAQSLTQKINIAKQELKKNEEK
jgi:hypothetical protein